MYKVYCKSIMIIQFSDLVSCHTYLLYLPKVIGHFAPIIALERFMSLFSKCKKPRNIELSQFCVKIKGNLLTTVKDGYIYLSCFTCNQRLKITWAYVTSWRSHPHPFYVFILFFKNVRTFWMASTGASKNTFQKPSWGMTLSGQFSSLWYEILYVFLNRL